MGSWGLFFYFGRRATRNYAGADEIMPCSLDETFTAARDSVARRQLHVRQYWKKLGDDGIVVLIELDVTSPSALLQGHWIVGTPYGDTRS